MLLNILYTESRTIAIPFLKKYLYKLKIFDNIASSEVFIQQFAVGFTFLDDTEGVVTSEVDEPFAWDEFGVMGFSDLEPAAVDPSADGLVLVAEDGFHVLGRDDVGQVVPLIVEPRAEVCGDLMRVEVVLIGLMFAGVI